MPQAGQILFCNNFDFRDGNTGRKLLVVLNSSEKYPCLVLKTTSKDHRYFNAFPGCNSTKRTFHIPDECGQDFKGDTYVQFPKILAIIP